MSDRSTEYLDRLREAYSAYPEFAGSELAKIDSMADELKKSQDPSWIAFRDNPITQKLVAQATATYKHARMQLANDDGTLTQIERSRLHVSSLWAMWYIKAQGGDPEMVKRKVEMEIETFAQAVGVA